MQALVLTMKYVRRGMGEKSTERTVRLKVKLMKEARGDAEALSGAHFGRTCSSLGFCADVLQKIKKQQQWQRCTGLQLDISTGAKMLLAPWESSDWVE